MWSDIIWDDAVGLRISIAATVGDGRRAYDIVIVSMLRVERDFSSAWRTATEMRSCLSANKVEGLLHALGRVGSFIQLQYTLYIFIHRKVGNS